VHFTGVGFGVLVVAHIRLTIWLVTSYRQTFCIRLALLQAVLRQEIGWFDTHDAGELGARLSELVLILFSLMLLTSLEWSCEISLL